ncbi:zinc-dependent metalloprotease [Lusitaniella coriacea]|uniref:zinc-dependent metalloprotease n=1 Tax=Lusitaniella coriacea TaxID=1983105 RepID=UPI003CF96E2A
MSENRPISPSLKAKKKTKSFDEIAKNTEKISGLFTLYRDKDKNKLYLEIQPEQLNKNYLCIITLSRGIGDGFLLNGLSLDNFLFHFRRVGDKVHFVLPNLNFRVRSDEPLGKLPENSFSDSVLYALDIVSIHPTRKTLLIDLSDLFLARDDLPGLNQRLPFLLGAPYTLDSDKSYFGDARAFPFNLEIETIYGFSAKGEEAFFNYLPTVPDSRAFNLSVHYSISELSANSDYIPRLADDRVGYFVTTYKDLSDNRRRDAFVRYINRWKLEPLNPKEALSPPKNPIIFWIENTVPKEYRAAIREGILIWNSAFEQAGFKNAIEVRQMPDNAPWNPADVRYNTIRWSNSLEAAFLGIGPSHVNPLTGQILDADIVIDANVVRSIKDEYRNLSSLNESTPSLAARSANWCEGDSLSPISVGTKLPPFFRQWMEEQDLCLNLAAQQELTVGPLALSLLQGITPTSATMGEYVHQFLRHLVAHEVGHTLGLRHNFHGSTMLAPHTLNDTSITHQVGLVSSVMDYVGVNLAPQGVEQGDYYPVIVGPYDRWAIEYGYKFSGERFPTMERRFLEQIARRAQEEELAYATDEDLRGFLDPDVNTFDLSNNVLLYAQWQMDNARRMWERLEKRYPQQGSTYSDIRAQFNTVFFYYFRQARLVTNYIGGSSFNRGHPSDPNGRLPFEPISVEKQREALEVLQKYVFAPDSFIFSPDLLNQLAPSRWNDFGLQARSGLDYPILDNILALQKRVLRSLLSNARLNQLRNLELKTQPDRALTLPELFNTLQEGIWTEVLHPNRETLNISSIRRALQREYLDLLTKMVLRRSEVPEDARTLAWYQLNQLEGSLEEVLDRAGDRLDGYTQAHLFETRDRILKALNAPLQSKQQLGKQGIGNRK